MKVTGYDSPKALESFHEQTGFRWQSPAELAIGRRKLTHLRNKEYANKILKAKILLTPSFLSNFIPNWNSTQVHSFVFLKGY